MSSQLVDQSDSRTVHQIPVANPGELAEHLRRLREHVDARPLRLAPAVYAVPVDPQSLVECDSCQ